MELVSEYEMVEGGSNKRRELLKQRKQCKELKKE